MYQIDNILYADENKVLDFKSPKYSLDESHVPVRVHLYSPMIKLGKMDRAENYIEVSKDEVK